MIKYILLLITFFICTSIHSQDTICLPSYKIIEIAQKIETNKTTIKLQESIIENLKTQIIDYDTLLARNEKIIKKKDEEISIYKNALIDYGPQTKTIKWYKTPVATYVLGILTGGSLLYISSQIFIK